MDLESNQWEHRVMPRTAAPAVTPDEAKEVALIEREMRTAILRWMMSMMVKRFGGGVGADAQFAKATRIPASDWSDLRHGKTMPTWGQLARAVYYLAVRPDEALTAIIAHYRAAADERAMREAVQSRSDIEGATMFNRGPVPAPKAARSRVAKRKSPS